MPTDLDVLSSELEGKLRPPVDVMLDPSLLVANASLERVTNSDLFDAQAQATLGQSLTQPRVGDIHVPGSFRHLLDESDRIDPKRMPAWNFYRGQADPAEAGAAVELLDEHGVRPFIERTEARLNWSQAIDASQQSDRLVAILQEECGFLAEGGILLSRTPESLRVLRDAGVVTIDIGRAELAADTRERLVDVGYGDPASCCAFAISTVSETVNGLASSLLDEHADLLCYRLGK